MKQYLQDKIFMKALMEHRDRTTYVRITALNLDLTERSEIMGYATEGSINVDGASAVRRSCNLTLITNQNDIKDYEWALSTRFRLEIGVANHTKTYLDEPIIWFPQGVYIITSFSAALGANSYTISISGQDKMCLMNGEVSGLVTAETDFGRYDEVAEDGTVTTHDLTLREIITSLVHTYGLEPIENMIIDLPDDSGYNLLTYRGETPLYLLRNKNTTHVEDFSFMSNLIGYSATGLTTISKLTNYWTPQGINDAGSVGSLMSRTTAWESTEEGLKAPEDAQYVQKIEYGQQAGYEETPLTFAGELKAAAGEAVTNILDKIKNMLGDFEYFYDVDGVFRFQKKKAYLKTYMNDNSAMETFANGEYGYEFTDLSMFTSFNANPNLKNLKNDFTVWGEYKTATGAALPIHMRVAIDKKPLKYQSPWQNKMYYANINQQLPDTANAEEIFDWRELIYQMAVDYQNHHLEYDYGEVLELANPDFVRNGRTGYEQYYTDILGFWRMLYEPNTTNAITEWVKTSGNNADVNKYIYPWVKPTEFNFNETVEDENGNTKNIKPYTSWYIMKQVSENVSYRIRWMDGLDLRPSKLPMYYSALGEVSFHTSLGEDGKQYEDESLVSVRRLFRKDATTGAYASFLGNKLPESSYYVYERYVSEDDPDRVYGSQGDKLVNLACSTTWGIEDNLSRLYLKKPNDPDSAAIPMQIKCPVAQITTNAKTIVGYRPGIYCAGWGTVPQFYDSFQYYNSISGRPLGAIQPINWANKAHITALIDAFTKPDRLVYLYKSDALEAPRLQYYASNMEAYLMRKHSVTSAEGFSHALYLKQDDGHFKLYAQHLMDEGLWTKTDKVDDGGHAIYAYQVLDEAWLKNVSPTNTVPTSSLEAGLAIDRENLYRKAADGSYIPAFECEELLTPIVKDSIQIQSDTLSKCAGINETCSLVEPYYPTRMSGDLTFNKMLYRPLEYWTYKTDYNLETHWLKQVTESPNTLLFWFDFLDPKDYPDLFKYSVQKIGARPMVKTEKNVKAIFYPETPDLYFGKDCPLEEGSKQYFTISSQGQSAHDTIDSWLYNHTYVTESVSVNSIPIYNLDPNTKIRIDDEEHDIHGDYIVDRLTIPLAFSGTMSITATKAPETF